MKVLWLCNFMLPVVADRLGLEPTNKEGWISGLASVLLERGRQTNIELAIAFPTPRHLDGYHEVLQLTPDAQVACFGFYEDTAHPGRYDRQLEERLKRVLFAYEPDLVHCFGTEYPHTLAMCRVHPYPRRILIGIQGLCAVYADAYFANLPQKVRQKSTLRDFLRWDTLMGQHRQFVRRGHSEIEAIQRAGNITGRTAWDRFYANTWHAQVHYYEMNETLRKDFYEACWKEENCRPHSIFLSQGDYPIKGLHYMLHALPLILAHYPDTQVFVAGNGVVKQGRWKWLKQSAYGEYVEQLLVQYGLQDKVHFLGKLNAGEMRQQYLSSHLFVCCSTIENSPNSLGEAMLLGMPCVTARVGGIESIFAVGEDGIGYEGFDETKPGEEQLQPIAKELAKAVIAMWADPYKRSNYCKNARNHARITHDRERNYQKLMEIYTDIYDREKK